MNEPLHTDQHTFADAYWATAQAIVARARAEADPPDSTQVFRSHSFEYVVLDEMGSAWEQEYVAIRRLDPAWSQVMRELRERVCRLEQEYHTWFESGGGYDEEHIPPAPTLDRTPHPLTWTNPVTGQICPQAIQIGQVVLVSSRWVSYRVPRPRWERHVTWYEASRGLLLHTATLSATLPEEKGQQEARATRFAETLSAICLWEGFFAAPHTVQRSIRKRFLALRKTFEQFSS